METKKRAASYEKTDEEIQRAFFDLLSKKDFHKITATDIIKKAGVNRSTFYRHCVDKYAILDKIKESAIPMGESMIAPFVDGEHNPFDILFNSDYLTSVVPEHFKSILLILLKVKTESFDMEKVVKEGYIRGFPIAEGDPMGTLKSELYADICYRLLIYSLTTKKDEDFDAYKILRDIAEYISPSSRD